jgi:membrane-associated PAP2 superfamily phosphatase
MPGRVGYDPRRSPAGHLMNRIGLVIALAVAGIVGVLFAWRPEWDLAISRLFYDADKHIFPSLFVPVFHRLREGAQWVVAAIAAPAVVALAVKLALPRRRMLIPARAVVFLLGTLIVGPGLLVNVTLKDYWPRSRPIDVPQLGGDEKFTPWWDPRGGCPKNCSSVAGEASGAFWTLAPAALMPPQWRPLAYAGALAFGAAVGALRIAFGGHFFTDVIFAGVLVFLLIWIAHGLLYRWRTRPSDDALERSLELASPTAWLMRPRARKEQGGEPS